MAKQDSKAHAEHVEQAADYLYAGAIFPDWVITTCFYASLHYVQYHTFPIKILLRKGVPSLQLDSFEEYHSYFSKHGKRMGRHERLRSLVEEKSPLVVSAAYSRLLELSYSSRYANYEYGPEIVEEARKKLALIKGYALGFPLITASA